MKKAKTIIRNVCVGALTALCATTTAYATGGDPLAIVNNLSDFIFSIIKAIGIIILGWGIVQVGMASTPVWTPAPTILHHFAPS